MLIPRCVSRRCFETYDLTTGTILAILIARAILYNIFPLLVCRTRSFAIATYYVSFHFPKEIPPEILYAATAIVVDKQKVKRPRGFLFRRMAIGVSRNQYYDGECLNFVLLVLDLPGKNDLCSNASVKVLYARRVRPCALPKLSSIARLVFAGRDAIFPRFLCRQMSFSVAGDKHVRLLACK